MKKLNYIYIVLFSLFFSSCDFYTSPEISSDEDSTSTELFVEQYDDFSDVGQYWLPQQVLGTSYWVVTGASSNDNTYDDDCLRNFVLAESIIGLTSLAVNEGTGKTMVWTEDPNSNYTSSIENTGMTCNGSLTTWELLDSIDDVSDHIQGYVLCNVRNEESLAAATVAAHVYRSIVVDKYYKDDVEALGYEMTYDARDKTAEDAWSEFKDSCNNNALVLMPTLTGNQKSFAIAHKLMFVNYNKEYESTDEGNNEGLIEEILDWLEPLSPVIGWEQEIDEKTFVKIRSRVLLPMVA